MSVPGEGPLIDDLGNKHGVHFTEVSALAGGSINQVYLLKAPNVKRVVKINDPEKYPGMFAAEKVGLDTLRETQTFEVPQVYDHGETAGKAFLLLEYKEQGPAGDQFWDNFGNQLSRLHQFSAETFGFPTTNYIGSLPQYNGSCSTATEFYVSQRLEPQVSMAHDNGFALGDLSGYYRNISGEIPEEPPSLIHGDLWSGNYLVGKQGWPILIDPAVCYGPREMDLAMMQLFGGFPKEVFESYEDHFPLQKGWEQRSSIWQLYYLLVHLNIMGGSYLPQVRAAIRRFL